MTTTATAAAVATNSKRLARLEASQRRMEENQEKILKALMSLNRGARLAGGNAHAANDGTETDDEDELVPPARRRNLKVTANGKARP